MLPPRWYGTTFPVHYSNEPSQKTPIKVHLITSRDSFELISLDWQTSLEQFSAQDIDRIESKKTTAVLTMKPLCKFTTISLNSAPDPCDHVVEALTITTVSPKLEVHFLTASSVIPSMRVSANTFQRSAVDLANQLLQFFGAQALNCPSVVDALVCFHRVRFPPDGVIDGHLPQVAMEIKRFLLVTWAKAYGICAQPVEGASPEFQQKMIQFIVIMLKKVAASVGIVGSLEGAPDAMAKRVGGMAQDAIDREEQVKRPADVAGARFLVGSALAMIGGAVAGMYESDLKTFAQGIVDYTQAIVDRASSADQARHVLQQKQATFLREMLCLLDGRRSDEVFQWIYCLWDLRGREGH
jgi:hypothetical protein